ncbi:MAG TPA: GlsB/YeaQ/YmgE family stress response membrane protein, partial [Terriglobales bacterium]|nr:GlsB/YeaQ/YmgE family stress response membrane protein [Terriglobales bacterium]
SGQPECSGGAPEAFMFFLYIILVGLVAGWAAGKIMKGSGYGPLVDIALGIVGAIVGGWIMRALGFYTSGGLIPSILVAILGAVVVIVIVRALRKV